VLEADLEDEPLDELEDVDDDAAADGSSIDILVPVARRDLRTVGLSPATTVLLVPAALS
jgi:hypothetical protein